MTAADLLVSVIILAGPVWEHRVGLPRLRAQLASGEPGALARGYNQIMLQQWGLTALALAVWVMPGRPLAALGLRLPEGWRAVLGLGLIVALVLLMVQQTRALRTQAAMRTKVRPQVESLAWFLPRTPVELRRFTSLSVTAGICEELLCRGWFLALLAPWLPPVVTLIATSVFFGLGHWYQGKAGVVKTGITGLIMGTVYLVTGSLLVPMILHAVVDIGGGHAAFIVLNDSPAPETVPAEIPAAS